MIRPSALTLIELLVVLSILSILVGSAIPVLSPGNDERRVREAARGLNTYISGAQTRAVQTGRPFGVRLRKLSQETGRAADNAFALEVSYVEVPPPFAGFDEGSRIMLGYDFDVVGGTEVLDTDQFRVQFVRIGNASTTDPFPLGFDLEELPPGLLRLGDVIEVGGMRVRLSGEGSSVDTEGFYNDPTARIAVERDLDQPLAAGLQLFFQPKYDNTGARLALPVSGISTPLWTEPLPYRIFRQPTPTSNEPYQLPEGTAIDLRASGIGEAFVGNDPTQDLTTVFYEDDDTATGDVTTETTNNPTTSNTAPIDILFSPEGTIERVVYDIGPRAMSLPPNTIIQEPAGPTTETLFLLVGSSLALSNSAAEADFGGLAGAGSDADVQERKALFNWLNADSRWVTVGARTGTVRTAPNAFVDPATIAQQVSPDDLTNFNGPQVLSGRRSEEINQARALAIEGVTLGGS